MALVIARLVSMSSGMESELPFTMVIDDPSGNSFVENPWAPNKDPALSVSRVASASPLLSGLSGGMSLLARPRRRWGEIVGADGQSRGR